MYRSRFNEILDQLRLDYEHILQENTALKQHIKELEEKTAFQLQEIKKTQQYIKDLNSYIKNMKRIPSIDLKNEERHYKKIKIGSGWSVEAESKSGCPFNIRLMKKYMLCNSVIKSVFSEKGRYVGFVSGRSCFYIDLEKDELFLLNAKKDWIDGVDFKGLKKNVVAEEGILEICFSGNNHLYTTNQDKVIRKWDVEERKLVKKISVKEEVSLMKTYKGSLYAVCKDMVLRIFDEDRMKEIALNSKGFPLSMGISDLNDIYVSNSDRKLFVVKPETDTVSVISLNKNFPCINIAKNDTILVTGDELTALYRINYQHMEIEPVKTQKIKMHNGQFITDKVIVGCGFDMTVKIFNLESGKVTVLSGYGDLVLGLAVNGELVCTASGDGCVKIWKCEMLK